MFGRFGLKQYGIVGMNGRNLHFIGEHNRRKHYPVADSKLVTKQLAQSVGIAVPELYGVVKFQHDVKHFEEIVTNHSSFVIKPVHGSGGEGIIVIKERAYRGYRKASGEIIELSDIRYHLQNVLSGMFSLGGRPDSALIEQTVEFDPVFSSITYQGVPDIRVVVRNGEALMAMLRLPTKASDGKANLHMGGIGAGIDMEKGITTTAVQYNRYIERHPETGELLAGHQIPNWSTILDIAVKMQQASGLGYVGVDIVLDKRYGPMILEINARPGLAIQIANAKGLLHCGKKC
jgi:alpha-L-glutamate ligase-like protein